MQVLPRDWSETHFDKRNGADDHCLLNYRLGSKERCLFWTSMWSSVHERISRQISLTHSARSKQARWLESFCLDRKCNINICCKAARHCRTMRRTQTPKQRRSDQRDTGIHKASLLGLTSRRPGYNPALQIACPSLTHKGSGYHCTKSSVEHSLHSRRVSHTLSGGHAFGH